MFDFDRETDLAYMLAILMAMLYVFDVDFPWLNKPILEMLDYFVFLSDGSGFSKTKTSSAKKLTVAAQNTIIEYEKKSN